MEPPTFWDYFQAQLRRRKMTQADVAREIGVPSSTVSRWQHQAPSPENLRRLAPVLRVPVVTLFVRAGHMGPGDVKLPPEPPAPELEQDPVEAAIEADPALPSRAQKDAALAVVRSLRNPGGGTGGGSRVTSRDREAGSL